MKRFMFSLDEKDPAGSAIRLREEGYDGVVTSVHAAEAKAAGLEVWSCFGAFSLRGGDPAELHVLDESGNDATWFGSGCPGARELWERNLDPVLEAAQRDSVRGIIVDGARFASFASQEGTDRFFGCFCPRCMAKMSSMGLDAEEIRSGISLLRRFLNGENCYEIDRMRTAIDGWMEFRTNVIREYMRWFTKKCHKAGLSAGAFVFAPSLAWAVGQRADALSELDLVSPMLYRAWPAEEAGPATLSHEWAGLMELLGRTEHHPQKLARYLFDLMFFTSDPLSGFAPEHLTMETDAMKGMLGGKLPVLPIVQANDPRLRDSVQAVLGAGADGYGEFSYSLKYE